MSATCLNRSNKEIDKIAKEFGEVKTSELLNKNFKKIPTYQEFINNPVVKQELGIVPISKVKDAIGRQFPKEINSNQLIDLKKLISSTNNKLKGIVYMLYNVSRIGQSDLHTWGLRKVEGDLDFEAKLQRALRTNTNTVEAQTKITELKRRVGEQQTLFQAESQSAIPSSIIKPGVQELFESNPELANIGTPQQYSQYLDTIFPDSKVKDIVYHGTPNDFELFYEGENNVIHFSKNRKDAEYFSEGYRIITAVLNMTNPVISKTDYDNLSQEDFDKFNKQGSIIAAGFEYVVKKNNQIHILGSKQDIEGFKKFVKQASFYQSTPQSTLPIDETVVYQFKVVNFITSNLPKINQWWKQLGNTDSFWNKVQQDLKIPKAQILLFRNAEGETVENKLASFAANYSYTVEINTAKSKKETGGEFDEDGRFIKYEEELPTEQPTQHYSYLTVPGGTNYTENEIATPAITPSIKGHAQFATDKGIGWFRSDNKALLTKLDNGDGTFDYVTKYGQTGDETKTRRILEVQSDLFQKGRDKELIVNEGYSKDDVFKSEQFKNAQEGDIIDIMLPNNKTLKIKKTSNVGFTNLDFKTTVNTSENKFLQLLNKDNNWVTFFVKSIIQDSAKKGYEKVLFPSGDTASKVEGHQTLTDELRRIDEKIAKETDKVKKPILEKFNSINEKILNLTSKKEVDRYNFDNSSGNISINNNKVYNAVKKGKFFSYTNLRTNEVFNTEFTQITPLLQFLNKQDFGEGITKENKEQKLNALLQEKEKINKELENADIYLEEGLQYDIQRRDQLKSEGIAKLKPIYNFYENIVTNILNKQYGKENVKQITDEYGNTWNEVKVQTERDLAPILFQSTSQSTRPVDTLANKMRELLQKLGFTVEEVDRLLAPDGTNVIAEVNLLDAIIRIAKGKADITTLPEEAATVVVEMVKGPLKDKMMRDITKFKIYDEVYATYSKFPNYQNEDGSVNEDKIKLEAISKLITRHLVNDYVGDENATNITGAMKWFQLVLNRIRSLFSKLSFDEYNAEIAKPFRDIANAMLSGDISSLESSAITSAGTFYQAQPQAKVEFTLAGFVDKIVEKSNSIIKPQNDVADSKYKYGNRQGVRITSVAKSRYKAIYGDQTTTREDAAAQFGTQAHEVQSFIIQKYFPEQNKHLVFTTNASSLEERSKFFSPFEEWVKSVKANGDILISEITVFGKAPVGKTYIDVGGTIDILRIRPDGTGDIYDLKTTKGMTKGKLKEWETQLGLYAHLLEQGDPKAGLPPIRIYEKRIIPLSTRTVTSGQTVKVVPVSFKDKLFLPLAAEESRKDEISAKIRKIRGVIELSERLLKGAKDAARERIKETIARNQALIENILLEAETEEVLTSLAYEVSLLEAQIEGGIDPKEYKVITSQLDAYESLAQDLRIKRDNAKAVATRKNILSDLTDIKQLLNDQEKKFITESVERLGFFGKFNLTKEGLFNNLKEIGFAAANVLGISSNPNAIAQSLYLTVSEAQDKAIAEYQDVVERLYTVMKKVADKRGATLDAFNPILEDDGKTLVRQVNSKFYKERAIALKKGGAELQNWLKENTEFDEARYLKSYEIMKKIKQNPNNIKALASDLIRRADLKNTELSQPTAEAQAKAILEKQLTEWVSKNRTLQMYNKPKLDKWTNPKYEALMKDKSLEDLKEYYMEYNKILDMLRDILPEHIQEGFIANFEAELLQKFRTHGVSALTDYAKETIQLRQNLEQKGVAGPTGELLRDIKIIGLEEIPGMEKSKDLTTSIAAFTFNALMYKHLSDVEHLALMTMNQVAGSKKYKVSLTGDIRLKNGQPDFIEGKGNLDNQIAAYIESVFYGIQKKDDYEKASSFLDKMIGYTTATNLILNPVAPIVDIIGNSSNALFTGAKNLYYGKKDIAWGLSMASAGDLGLTKDQRIAKALIKKFRVLNERYAKDEQDKLNIQLASLNFNKISAKALDSNTWYKPYQVSDYVIQNGVLLAMLKSGKYNYKLSDYDIDDNNNLVWVGTGTEPSNLEFTKFRQTVKSVNKNIAGNYDPYDAMMAKQYVAGRMLMQHRGWMPAQFLERFGNERPDYILGQMIEGRYRTLTKYVKNLIVEHNIAALKGEQLSESQRANMKANLAEMAVLVGIVLLLSLLKGDDDDVELRKRNAYAIRITTRWFNELVFFYDPTLDSIKAIIQSPVPSSSIMDKGTTLFNKIYDVTFGDEESLEDVTRSAARFIPAANGIWNGIDLIEGAVEGK